MKQCYTFKNSYFLPVIAIFLGVFNPQVGNAKSIADKLTYTPISLVAPTIEDQNFTVTEGSAAGTVVGQVEAGSTTASLSLSINTASFTGAANIPQGDSEDDPAYDAAGVFQINEESGEISVNNPKYLLENLGPIEMEVIATDAQGAEATALIMITITDLEVSTTDNLEINWSQLANHPQGHSEATGGIVGEKLYVFSGFTANYAPKEAVFAYDIPNNTWSRLADMPPMANNSGAGGATHMGWTTDGTDIYVAAGYAADISGNAQQFASQRVYRYVVSEDRYEELPSLPLQRSAGALAYIDNKLYYVAGTNPNRDEDQSDLLVLDLENPGAGWSMLSQMPNPRNHVGSVVFDEQLYVFGGQKEHDEELVPQDDVHRYDPATDQWTHVTDMPQPFNHIHASVFAYGEYIYSIGGQIEHNAGAYASVYAYNTENGEWLKLTDLPAARFSTVAGAANGKLFASGGNNSRTTYVADLPQDFLSTEKITIAESAKTSVYPNPTNGQLYLHNPANTLWQEAGLYDLNGRMIKTIDLSTTKPAENYRISLENLPAGAYFLRLSNDKNQQQTKKIMLQ